MHLESPRKSLNFNANIVVLSRAPKKKEHTQKDLGIKLLTLWKNQKDIDSRLFFACNGLLEKMGNVSLKSP